MCRGVESLCKLLTANKVPFDLQKKRVQIKILSILKLVSFKSLTGNDLSERGTLAEAQCERKLSVGDSEEGPAAPPFWTKLRPEGPKKIFGRPPPPPSYLKIWIRHCLNRQL